MALCLPGMSHMHVFVLVSPDEVTERRRTGVAHNLIRPRILINIKNCAWTCNRDI